MLLIGILLILFLTLGLPIAFTLGFPSIFYIILNQPDWLEMVPRRIFSGLDSFVFLAIPFFIMAGEIMTETGVTKSLIKFSESIVGRVRGGLAYVNVLTSMLFGGISGAAISDVAALGSIFIPAMEKEGYDRDFATAVTCASSIQGPIIPPSIIVVVYAGIMGTSVGALLIAGIIPGILIGLSDFIIVYSKSKARNYPKRDKRISFNEIFISFIKAIPALMLPVIIIGGIVGGIFTPTEAGAIACIYGLILGFALRRLNIKSLIRIAESTVLKTAVLFIIVGFAQIFSWVLAMERIPAAIEAQIFGVFDTRIMILLVMNILFLFVGTWLETSAAIILLAPVFGPALVGLGVHPIHLGMIMVVNLTIGLITPPFGVVLYAGVSVGKTKFEHIVKEIWPYVLVDIGILGLVTFLPEISLFLPRAFGLI